MVIGGFATLSMLTKNSFLDEINKQYVVTARAKGLDERDILYKHVFRNAMLIIIAGFPAAFINIFFTGSMLIEVMFSLEGIGLLGFESTIQRDYPVVFSSLYIMTLLGLVLSIISDLTYTWVDPRIDFEGTLMFRRSKNPLNQARWQRFKANKRGFWSMWIFTALFVISLLAEVIANDKPLLVEYNNQWYLPIVNQYAETEFGGEFETEADYTDPYVIELIEDNGYIV